MSSLLLLNGSPRGARSNSMKMLARVGDGWASETGGGVEVLHLAKPADFERAVQRFWDVDAAVLGMPLYTDSMPGLVKAFIEALGEGELPETALRLGFLVQSGFNEALHSRPLERYLAKLAPRLGCAYAGTIVKGGGEALQVMPDEASGRLWERLRGLGASFGRDGEFAADLLRSVAGTERLSTPTAAVMSVVLKAPVMQFYWNGQLKKNGAWDTRFAAPYAEGWAR